MRNGQRSLTAAEQQLVLQAHRVVRWAVRSFVLRCSAARGFEDDLASYAWMGAMYAAQRWLPDGGASFVTFARRPVRHYVMRGWLALAGVTRDEDGAYVPRHELPLDVDELLSVVVPPTQERTAEAHRLSATLGERLCAHMRPGMSQPVREKAVQAYLLRLDGETLESIGQHVGGTRQRAQQLLTQAEEAALRWAASLTPSWERGATHVA
ncbi:sigma-70 family RNA polymerase sigma factor [Myxococcus llanfairpwllgwyngyllgogerychwyrndrobwllllantysiliogogogochensis]|uniref:Sigma-70 family RNA polymerase sigma factor n=1 Tax=Myxococcus llanfairpwllgwyngyllgogerychwyrndrobwllllantysiliogogogochensis TaxID=2590453 RepID=A0A540WYY7_9BACT|nr:sigma-70 family RNA polymerase sigma factor [Myxococcus llanfairpwllgwyngyllgogerychwyrndrobwllllantysiliogogogochensis]TQF14226.1 sigma-70 family RNA polymerase sigma factor [Myxococcus llanfairpwllgwyngyllgogerychwyrndrobwllllantysiliogogogochensis]